MRSDREELPEGWTKEQADKAEMKEARLQKEARTSLQARVAPGCQLYWPSEFEVCGAIRDKYNSLGAQFSFLLLPTTPELVNPDGYGRRSHFQNGPIYWSAATGAHPVVNVFHQKWGEKGWEGGFLGYPKTDEVVLNGGRLQDFTGATIYWSPLTGAHPVGGAIRDKWAQTGWEGGTLGYPTSDETVVGHNGEGRMNRFERGVIYWSPSTGAHSVLGDILEQWSLAGYEKSSYGYPTGEQYDYNGDPRQDFQGGNITAVMPAARFIDLAAAGALEQRINDRVSHGESLIDATAAEILALLRTVAPLPEDGSAATTATPQSQDAPQANAAWTHMGKPPTDQEGQVIPIRQGNSSWGYIHVAKHNVKYVQLMQWMVQYGDKDVQPQYGGPDYDGIVVGRGRDNSYYEIPVHMGTDLSTRRDDIGEDSPDGLPVGMITVYCPEEEGIRCPDAINDRELYRNMPR